ncbi:MAG: alpha/beta fold hydrolase [Acidobacteria bacterium]|nr:alpha/beta fold hydrolase [Acidobacteriota bacterium]
MRTIELCLIGLLLLSASREVMAQTQMSDPRITLNYQEKLIEEKGGVRIFDGSYAGVEGGRVDLYLLVPQGKGPFAGILFQRGSEQSRLTYLAEAVLLARAGAICMVTDVTFPELDPTKLDKFRNEYIKMMFNVRHATDLLVARDDVDKNRIGFVGHSYGAMIGAVLAVVDKRIKAFVLVAGLSRLSDHMRSSTWWQPLRDTVPKNNYEAFLAKIKSIDPAEYIGKSSPAPILFQCANYDEVVPKEACQALYQAAGEPKQIKWYECRHDFQDFDAHLDRVKWLQQNLRLKALGPILQRKLAEK